MLIPTEAIATAPAISSALAISPAPGKFFDFPCRNPRLPGNPQIRPPGLRNPPSMVPTGFPWPFLCVTLHVYPERAGIPKLEGGCHSSLGSSGYISISHSGVSRGHWNVPHTSIRHYGTLPDSPDLFLTPVVLFTGMNVERFITNPSTHIHITGLVPFNRLSSTTMDPFRQDPLLARKD